SERMLSDALAAGCLGVVSKSASLEALKGVVRTVATGQEAIVGVGSGYVPYVAVGERALTPREIDVLRAMAAGQSSASIARELGLSAHTVRNHMRKLFVKLRAHSKLEAVLTAARAGLVELDE